MEEISLQSDKKRRSILPSDSSHHKAGERAMDGGDEVGRGRVVRATHDFQIENYIFDDHDPL